MQQSSSIAERVERAVAPLLETMGIELVCAEFLPKSSILRLYIDREAGVTLDDCSLVSRRVSDMLDAEGTLEATAEPPALSPGAADPPPTPVGDAELGVELERYTLEVSSPGLDRPLTKPKHFARFVGREVVVQLHEPLPGTTRRKWTGTLVQVGPQNIVVCTAEDEQSLAFTLIGRARLVPDFQTDVKERAWMAT